MSGHDLARTFCRQGQDAAHELRARVDAIFERFTCRAAAAFAALSFVMVMITTGQWGLGDAAAIAAIDRASALSPQAMAQAVLASRTD
jgi:hypothetical protein